MAKKNERFRTLRAPQCANSPFLDHRTTVRIDTFDVTNRDIHSRPASDGSDLLISPEKTPAIAGSHDRSLKTIRNWLQMKFPVTGGVAAVGERPAASFCVFIGILALFSLQQEHSLGIGWRQEARLFCLRRVIPLRLGRQVLRRSGSDANLNESCGRLFRSKNLVK